jgi:hypothetical protein
VKAFDIFYVYEPIKDPMLLALPGFMHIIKFDVFWTHLWLRDITYDELSKLSFQKRPAEQRSNSALVTVLNITSAKLISIIIYIYLYIIDEFIMFLSGGTQ